MLTTCTSPEVFVHAPARPYVYRSPDSTVRLNTPLRRCTDMARAVRSTEQSFEAVPFATITFRLFR